MSDSSTRGGGGLAVTAATGGLALARAAERAWPRVCTTNANDAAATNAPANRRPRVGNVPRRKSISSSASPPASIATGPTDVTFVAGATDGAERRGGGIDGMSSSTSIVSHDGAERSGRCETERRAVMSSSSVHDSDGRRARASVFSFSSAPIPSSSPQRAEWRRMRADRPLRGRALLRRLVRDARAPVPSRFRTALMLHRLASPDLGSRRCAPPITFPPEGDRSNRALELFFRCGSVPRTAIIPSLAISPPSSPFVTARPIELRSRPVVIFGNARGARGREGESMAEARRPHEARFECPTSCFRRAMAACPRA